MTPPRDCLRHRSENELSHRVGIFQRNSARNLSMTWMMRFRSKESAPPPINPRKVWDDRGSI